MTEPDFSRWWRDDSSVNAIGFSNVFELQAVYQQDTTQHFIEIYQHDVLGRVLVLDGKIKSAQYETAWCEMLVHVPLLAKPRDNAKVMILGGGSGELLEQVLQHDSVTQITVIEADSELIEIAKTRLGYDAAFSDPRVIINTTAQQHDEQYDIILCDRYQFNQQQHYTRLSEQGVVATWQPVIPDNTVVALAALQGFSTVEYYQVFNPLVAGGTAAVFLYNNHDGSHSEPHDYYIGRHYNPELHRAAFAVPTWWQTQIAREQQRVANPELWFEHTEGTGISQCLAVQNIYHTVSEFQKIEYYQHAVFGRVFVLDDTIQCSHADEFIYHEMAVHIPLLGRQRDSARVLVIGGGDGGIVRELLNHDEVTQIVMVEIDQQVITTANHYFGIQGDYDNPRVELHIGDAAEYVANAKTAGFELIIVDATDSTAPSASLWNDTFFANLERCLTPDGVCLDSDILIAGRRFQLSRDVPENSLRDIKRAQAFFPTTQAYMTKIPLFPGSYFAFFLYNKDSHSYAKPYRNFMGKHYNPALHEAAFALPSWWRNLLAQL